MKGHGNLIGWHKNTCRFCLNGCVEPFLVEQQQHIYMNWNCYSIETAPNVKDCCTPTAYQWQGVLSRSSLCTKRCWNSKSPRCCLNVPSTKICTAETTYLHLWNRDRESKSAAVSIKIFLLSDTSWIGKNCIHTPYMIVCISLLQKLHIHRMKHNINIIGFGQS